MTEFAVQSDALRRHRDVNIALSDQVTAATSGAQALSTTALTATFGAIGTEFLAALEIAHRALGDDVAAVSASYRTTAHLADASEHNYVTHDSSTAAVLTSTGGANA